MTADAGIGEDAANFFQNMSISNLRGEYSRLLVAPYSLKNHVLGMIDAEVEKARSGQPACIFIKINSLTDRDVIDALARASQAGVEITMNIRGICCLRPGVPGLTDNIRVFSIVGRFLEHPRIFAFGTGRDMKLYIGSADLMTRNTCRRVEIACPVLDEEVRRRIVGYIELFCSDNMKARNMLMNGCYVPVPRAEGTPSIDSQAELMAEAVSEAKEGRGSPASAQRKARASETYQRTVCAVKTAPGYRGGFHVGDISRSSRPAAYSRRKRLLA